jgi:iron complex transport system substrate-binding protein
MMRSSPLPVLLAIALCMAAAIVHAAPQRIASLNLCTDQLLLMLAPRARIASLTDWAARPESSYMAAAAVGIPVNHGLAEGVLPQRPDLVIAGEYNDTAMLHLLRQLGYRVEVVKVPRSLAEAQAFILQFGELIGAPERARALVDTLRAQLAALDAEVAVLDRAQPASERPLAAVYAPNGFTPGRDTVMSEILARAGLRNLAAEIGIQGYGQLSLETLLTARPDVLVLEATADTGGSGSIAHSYLQHPVLQSLARRVPSLTMPPPLSECVGPMTVAAIGRLVELRRRHPELRRAAMAGVEAR